MEPLKTGLPLLLKLFTMQNECPNYESNGLLQGEEGDRPDEGEPGRDEEGANKRHHFRGLAVTSVAPKGGGDPVAAA